MSHKIFVVGIVLHLSRKLLITPSKAFSMKFSFYKSNALFSKVIKKKNLCNIRF